jgi:hypothetical protein
MTITILYSIAFITIFSFLFEQFFQYYKLTTTDLHIKNVKNYVDGEMFIDKLVFPNSKPVPISYKTKRWSKIFQKGEPIVFKSLLGDWKSVQYWSPTYLSTKWQQMKVHVTNQSTTRMFSNVQPFGRVLNWTTGYDEKIVAGTDFFAEKTETTTSSTTSKIPWMYLFAPVKQIPKSLHSDFNRLVQLGTDIDSAGFWSGAPTLSSPLHYDAAHNVYCQIFGYKRFILFPHNVSSMLYVHSRLHPSTRSSFVNLRNVDQNRFPLFENAVKTNSLHPMEVVLGPGDALYIPPYYWHRASVVGKKMSMSMAIYSTSTMMKKYPILKSYPVPIDINWLWNRKVAALKTYICVLGRSIQSTLKDHATSWRCSEWISKMLEQRYDSMLNDPKNRNIVIGWENWINKHRKYFQWKTKNVGVPQQVTKYLIGHVHKLHKELLRKIDLKGTHDDEDTISKNIWETEFICLAEDVVNYILGTEYVEPFLRYVAGDLILW